MISALISRLVILAFGTLYPAYASYKAVRTKDVKEYVKWMMYWIVFALFTCAETFTDVLFSFWFPFYYELKVAIVLWLLSPATKGSSFLYKTFVHPAFLKREDEIDEMLVKAKERGYSTVMRLGSKGVTYATNVILQTAMKGGGGLVDHIRKSYSLTDLGPKKGDRFLQDETDAIQGDDLVGGSLHFLRRMLSAPSSEVREEVEELAPRPVLRRRPPGPAPVDMKFREVDVNLRQFRSSSGPLGDIQSTEDISSGYSSTDQLFPGQSELVLSKSFVAPRGRGRTPKATQPKRTPLTEETEDGEEGEFSFEPFYDSYPQPNPSEVPYSVFGIARKFSGQYEEPVPSPTCPLSSQEACLITAPEAANINGSQTSLASSSSDKSERKGKYGKLPAPRPPPEMPLSGSVPDSYVPSTDKELQNMTSQEGKTSSHENQLRPKTKESLV